MACLMLNVIIDLTFEVFLWVKDVKDVMVIDLLSARITMVASPVSIFSIVKHDYLCLYLSPCEPFCSCAASLLLKVINQYSQ